MAPEAAFSEAQNIHARGRGMAKFLQKTGLVENGVFQTERLQQILANPDAAARLEKKIGPFLMDDLVNAVTRGGVRGDVDVARQMPWAYLGLGLLGPASLRIHTPGFMTRYAGQTPFAPTPERMTRADVLAGLAAHQMRPRRREESR